MLNDQMKEFKNEIKARDLKKIENKWRKKELNKNKKWKQMIDWLGLFYA